MYAFIIYLHKCLVYAMQNATHLICKSESGVSLEKSHKSKLIWHAHCLRAGPMLVK